MQNVRENMDMRKRKREGLAKCGSVKKNALGSILLHIIVLC